MNLKLLLLPFLLIWVKAYSSLELRPEQIGLLSAMERLNSMTDPSILTCQDTPENRLLEEIHSALSTISKERGAYLPMLIHPHQDSATLLTTVSQYYGDGDRIPFRLVAVHDLFKFTKNDFSNLRDQLRLAINKINTEELAINEGYKKIILDTAVAINSHLLNPLNNNKRLLEITPEYLTQAKRINSLMILLGCTAATGIGAAGVVIAPVAVPAIYTLGCIGTVVAEVYMLSGLVYGSMRALGAPSLF